MKALLLVGDSRQWAESVIKARHYSHSVPAGKSHYVQAGDALVVWSIPANKNIGRFLLGENCNVWELARLWAPDDHERNLLTRAISLAVKVITTIEHPDVLVSYADPNVGHHGGVYRAASWVHHGTSEEGRYDVSPDGQVVSRRSFHSGPRFLLKREILALGYVELKRPGKERFVKPLTKRARKALATEAARRTE